MRAVQGVFHGGPIELVFASLPDQPEPPERVGLEWTVNPSDETVQACRGWQLVAQTYHFVYELECIVDGVAHYFCDDVQ